MNKALDSIEQDMISALTCSDYEAVDVLWVALVKIANLMPGRSEHKRMMNLVNKIPDNGIKVVLNNPGINTLLNLDPPLETILTDEHEHLYTQKTKIAFEIIAKNRKENPREALVSLGEILKRIRNKRAHGFKTSIGPRDQIILKSAKSILKSLCEVCMDELISSYD